MDIFLDSFENANFYQYIKSDTIDFEGNTGKYLIIQTPSHPDFSIFNGDAIYYLKDEGGLLCRTVSHVDQQKSLSKYYTVCFNQIIEEPVYDEQILGKVVSVLDNNPWTNLALQVWDYSINNLNAAAIFTNH